MSDSRSDVAIAAAAAEGGLALTMVGRGPTVLCLHSSGLSGRQWRRLADALAPTHQVLMPDLLGYGHADKIDGLDSYGIEVDIESLRPLIAAVPKPIAFVGHSYGGFLSLLLAAELGAIDPLAVASVSAYEPVAFGTLAASAALGLEDDPALADLDGIQTADHAFFDLSHGGYEQWLHRFVEHWNGPGGWDAMHAPAQTAFRMSQVKMHREVEAIYFDPTPIEHYGTIRARCLFLYGHKTRPAAKAICHRLANYLPTATLASIPKAGHMGPITHKGPVNRMIIDHVRAS